MSEFIGIPERVRLELKKRADNLSSMSMGELRDLAEALAAADMIMPQWPPIVETSTGTWAECPEWTAAHATTP